MILPPHQRTGGSQPHAPTDFARQVLEGLPLAHASLALFAYGVPTSVLTDLFHRHRGRGYEDVVTFPQLVDWIFDALVEHHGSGRQAHLRRHRQRDDAGNGAFYGKLRRIPPGLSEAFLHDITDRFTALFPDVVAHHIPTPFDAFEVLVLDGKSLKKVARRLVQTRGTPGKLLGGKLLVAYRPRDGLVLDMAADLDGETNEAELVPHLMPRLHARGGRAKLVVGDRLFCSLKHFAEFTKENGHFVSQGDGRTTHRSPPRHLGTSPSDRHRRNNGRRLSRDIFVAPKPHGLHRVCTVQVLQGYVVARQKLTIEDLSTEQFRTDWHRQLVALKELVEVDMIVSLIPSDLTVEGVRTLLDRLLGRMWKPGWDKTRDKLPRAHRHAAKQKGAHTSVQRRLQVHKSNAEP